MNWESPKCRRQLEEREFGKVARERKRQRDKKTKFQIDGEKGKCKVLAVDGRTQQRSPYKVE